MKLLLVLVIVIYCGFFPIEEAATVVDSTICDVQKDIYDKRGRYSKTVCLVKYYANYTATNSYLQSKGFKLYSAASSIETQSLFDFATSIFGTGQHSELWVGAELINGKWITSSGKPLYSGAVPTKDLGLGNCLMTVNIYGNFEFVPRACNVPPWSFAEFVNSTKSGTKAPCGTFVHYDIVNNIRGPKRFGFAGGVHYGNSLTEYVGYGSVNCGLQNPAPGYILRKPAATAGAYLQCGNDDVLDKINAHYLLRNNKLRWVSANTTSVSSIPGTLKMNSLDTSMFAMKWTFTFARIKYEGIYYLGKVIAGYGSPTMVITTATGYKFLTTGFQVLTCRP